VREIKDIHGGRPILVGTISVSPSASISHELNVSIIHSVLNAKYHQTRKPKSLLAQASAGRGHIATNRLARNRHQSFGQGVAGRRRTARDGHRASRGASHLIAN